MKTWSTVADMANDINRYFNRIEEEGRIPTLNGLANHLDMLVTRLGDYPVESEFYETVQKAIGRIAEIAEELSMKKDPTHWIKSRQAKIWEVIEKQEVTNTGGLNININADRENNL